MTDSGWLDGIDGGFKVHSSIQDALPKGHKITSAEPFGRSAWNQTAKLTASLPEGNTGRYFLKQSHGKSAEPSLWGQYASVNAMNRAVPGCAPEAIAKGDYFDDAGNHVYFFIQRFHDFDLHTPADPEEFALLLSQLHRVKSPNGMFGFDIPVSGGTLVLQGTWEKTWAAHFAHQMRETIRHDNAANPSWPDYDRVCQQVLDYVIPRLLGALQSDGRHIDPVLVHMDLWEGNVAIDLETRKPIFFDPNCVYGHNELEFGTWRSIWATYFKLPIYQTLYQRKIEPSQPVEEWADRNRLYSARALLCESGGHPGSRSRQFAYNDMLFLCKKYAPFDHVDAYDPSNDISIRDISESYDALKGAKVNY